MFNFEKKKQKQQYPIHQFKTVMTIGLLAIGFFSHSSNYIKNFTQEDGIYQASINTIVQDSNGYLLFGSQDGLLKFDGIDFHSIRNNQPQYSELASNHINVLYTDESNTVWIGSKKGLYRFNENLSSISRMHKEFDHAVSAIFVDDQKSIWIGTQNKGLFVSSFPYESIKPIEPINNEIRAVNKIKPFSDSHLLVATDNLGLVKYDLITNTLTQLLGSENVMAIKDFAALRNGSLLSAYKRQNGIHVFSKNETDQIAYQFLKDELASERINSILYDQEGNFWFGTETGTGLIKYNHNNKEIKRYPSKSNQKGLVNNQVWSIFEDLSKNIWVGTNAGITKLSKYKERFGHFAASENQIDLDTPIITASFEDTQGNLWIGTYGGGLFKFDDLRNSFQKIPFGNVNDAALGNEYVISLNQASDGTLWIGTTSGLSKIDSSTFEPVDFSEKQALSKYRIFRIVKDAVNNMWLNTRGQVYVYQSDKNSFCRIEGVAGKALQIFRNKNHIWLIKNDGSSSFYQIDSTSFNCSSVVVEQKSIEGLSNFDPKHLDSNDNIWTAVDGGLVKLNARLQIDAILNEKSGLPNGTVHDVLEDEQSNLWVSTNHGLAMISTKDLSIKNYYAKNGLQSDEFNGQAATKRRNGELVFGGMKGINVFLPKDIEVNPITPRLHVTEIKVTGGYGTKHLLAQFYSAQESIVEILPEDKVLQIEFIALHYQDSKNNQYRYLLKGFDSSWVYASANNRVARYTNLSPGEYTFFIEASNSDNVWIENPNQIKFKILTPWYQTIWAYIFYALILLCSILLLIKLRVYDLQRKNRLLEEEVSLRTEDILEQKQTIENQVEDLKALDKAKEKFFENISHEFRTPLALTIGPLKRLYLSSEDKKLKDKLEVPIRQSSRLLRLINQFLEISRVNSGLTILNRRHYRLADQIRQILVGFKDSIELKGIEIKLNLDNEVVLYYDASAMEKIVVNLLSNAINYSSDNSKIVLTAKKIKLKNIDNASISIQDQGVGIGEEMLPFIFERFNTDGSNSHYKHGMGVGLSLVKELVELHEGEVSVKSARNIGSTFIVNIPITNKSEQLTKLDELGDFSDTTLENTLIQQTVASSDSLSPNKQDQNEKWTILIADDELDMRIYLGELLSEYNLLFAKNGLEALKLAQKNIPDIILSDVMMPEMDGISLVQSLKEERNTSHIPIILVTAKGGRNSKLEGLREGIDDYIVKPFDDEELKLKVNNILVVRNALAESAKVPYSLNERNQTPLPKVEQNFIAELDQFIEKHYSELDLGVTEIANAMHLEKRQLQRKLRGILNLTPSDYLRSYRLNKAAKLLISGESVSIAFESSGFAALSHFSRCFKAVYGVTPSQYFKHYHGELS